MIFPLHMTVVSLYSTIAELYNANYTEDVVSSPSYWNKGSDVMTLQSFSELRLMQK